MEYREKILLIVRGGGEKSPAHPNWSRFVSVCLRYWVTQLEANCAKENILENRDFWMWRGPNKIKFWEEAKCRNQAVIIIFFFWRYFSARITLISLLAKAWISNLIITRRHRLVIERVMDFADVVYSWNVENKWNCSIWEKKASKLELIMS